MVKMEDYSDIITLSYIFVGLLLLIALSLFVLFIFSGLLASVVVKTSSPPIGEVYIAYKDGTGHYSGVGSNFFESTSIAPDLRQIGLYFDEPGTKPDEELRWAVGAILSENGSEVDEKVKAAYAKEKYNFMTLPSVEASVNCSFPYINQMSIIIAAKRVYPAISNYIKEHGLTAYPCVEAYYGGHIHHMFPLSKHDEFFTPGTLGTKKDKTTEENKDPAQPPSQSSGATQPHTDTNTNNSAEAATDSDDSFEKLDADEIE